jgi:hypothetical protein
MQALKIGEERVWPNEAKIAEDTLTLVKQGLIDTPKGELVRRDAHPHAHGCVHATFTVLEDIPAAFRHGFFATPKSYPVWIRFSNGNKGPDTNPDIRGMAMKVCQVPGEKVLPLEKLTQDFLLVSHPVMPVGDPAGYYAFFRALIHKNPLYAIFGMSPFTLMKALAITLETVALRPANPLTGRYFSATAYKMGDGAVKYGTTPSASMNAASVKRPEHPGPLYLREAMAAWLADKEAEFDFMVQPQVDPVTMPIENAAKVWSEEQSPFVKVASIRIPKQSFLSPAQETFCENLSINPWHCLLENRPLGGINRVRRVVYENISAYRHSRNGAALVEPTGDERF